MNLQQIVSIKIVNKILSKPEPAIEYYPHGIID